MKQYQAFLDIGFAYEKAINNKDNKRVLQPSIYANMTTNANGTEAGVYSDFGNYLVGNSALNSSSMPQRFQGFNDCLSSAYAATVLYVISKMNGSLEFECELILSLPFESWRNNRLDLMQKLSGTHQFKRLGYRQQKITISFHPKWGVVPQNVMPVFAGVDFSKGNGVMWIASGNAGGYTFEQGAFGIDFTGSIPSLVAGTLAQQGSLAKGVYTLANDVRLPLLDYLNGKRAALDQHEIFDILTTDNVQYGGKQIDVSEIIKPIKNEYLESIRKSCLGKWNPQTGREIGRFNIYYQSGGGAHIVVPYLREVNFHNNIVVSDDPQFDVCIGSRNWHKLIGE